MPFKFNRISLNPLLIIQTVNSVLDERPFYYDNKPIRYLYCKVKVKLLPITGYEGSEGE